MKKTYFLLFTLLAMPAFGAFRYVDNNSPGGNDGLSWATAWDHPNQIGGVGGGDTVFISGGTTSKTYVFTGFWDVPGGTSTNQLIISRSTDTGHNGIVIFNASNTSIPQTILTGLQYVTFDFSADHNAKPTATSCRLQFSGSPSSGCNVLDSESTGYISNGFKIYGAIFNWRIVMYASRDVEISSCTFNNEGRKLTGGPGWLIGIGSKDTRGYGFNKVHHNRFNLFYLRVPDANGDNGDDGMQNCGGSGGNIDIYNNDFVSTLTTGFAGANHQDGVQMDGNFIRIWNNYFENISNYCVFGEYWAQAGANGWRVYNNVFNYSDAVLTGNPTQAIAIGNSKGNPSINITYTDNYIFNNTFRGAQQAIAFGVFGMTQTLVNCRFQNNLRLTEGGGIISVHGTQTGGTVVSNNPSVASNAFVNVATGDFHLTSNATAAIGQGTTSGGLFPTITTTDKDGVSRGSVWDIGAYQFASAVGPGSVAFATVPLTIAEGAGTLAVTVNRVNGTTGAIGVSYATSNGSATSGSDYTAASGTLSWASGDGAPKTFNVTIAQDATVEGNEDFTVTLSSPTGGASIIGVTSTNVTIVDDESPTVPLMGSLTFAANLGLIEPPFTAAGAVVSQTVDTGNTDGGRARYRVTIPSTGAYSITMDMNCASTGTDSVYVSVDGEPLEPANVFDVGVTSGFQTKPVTWRGAGSPAAPQFNPNFWNLTAGVHELTIRGREPGAQFNSITVVPPAVSDTAPPTPNPPTWSQDPIAPVGPEGQSRITMTVNTVSDPSGPIEYYFDETSGGPGGTDSGWQQTVDYTDEGLTPNTTYTYQVKARDSEGNETSLSAVGSGTTNPIASGGSTINATNLIIDP